jgi:uncharacterized cupin superfamily protein
MSAMAVNWDDVQGRRLSVGPLDSTCSDLGVAARTRGLGLRRFEIEPGKRSTPAHTHSGEEEIFYVLAGSGLSWQASATHRVETGDCLVHLIRGPAHTLIAGPEGLDVLAFGERAATEACYLPRAQVAWLGASWVKAGESEHPFAQEAAVGDIEMPDPSPRPSTIVRTADVASSGWEHGDSVCSRRELGAAAGAQRTALRRFDLPVGKIGAAPHCHSGCEELFVVLAGSGAYLDQAAGAVGWQPREHPVRRGDVVSVPAGTGIAHAFRGGPDGLTFLAYGNRDTDDVTWYPRSQKIAFFSLGVMGRFERAAYWDGEE